MYDEARSFDVAQKTDPETGTQMRAFDETGQIGDDKRAAEFGAVAAGAAVGIDDAEIGLERGERIICNFRTGRGNHGNQCGLAGIGETNEADVGEQFKFEAEMALFSGKAILMLARS